MRKKFKLPSLVEDISPIPDHLLSKKTKNSLITETVPNIAPPPRPSSFDTATSSVDKIANSTDVIQTKSVLKKAHIRRNWWQGSQWQPPHVQYRLTPRIIGGLVGLVVISSLIGWQVITAGRLVRLFQDPEKAAQHEIEQTMKELNTLIILPQDEYPTIATVTDKSKLDQQTFFQYAENGDKVIMYPQARKAYLYRPSIRKLIEVAPLNVLDSPQGQASPVELDTSSVTNQ